MPPRLSRVLQAMEIEERLLNLGAFVGCIGVFLPWIAGDWLGGEKVSYGGLGFYTKFLGICILLLCLFLLAVSLVPALGGPVIVKRRFREITRLWASAQAVILTMATLSVLMRVTFEFTHMELKWGIYVTLVGSLLALFESFVKYMEQKRTESEETFHHPEDGRRSADHSERTVPPPPPPPPPRAPALDDHRHYR